MFIISLYIPYCVLYRRLIFMGFQLFAADHSNLPGVSPPYARLRQYDRSSRARGYTSIIIQQMYQNDSFWLQISKAAALVMRMMLIHAYADADSAAVPFRE